MTNRNPDESSSGTPDRMHGKKARRSHWVQVFSEETWREFLTAGAKITGFREKRWPMVKQIKPGDYLFCYVSRVGVWIGVLKAISEPYMDNSRNIWKDHYPCRVGVKPVMKLNPENAVPIKSLREQLSIFEAQSWGAHFMGSPSKFSDEDAAVVLRVITYAKTRDQSKSSTRYFKE